MFPSMRVLTLLLVAGVALAGDPPTLPQPRSEHGAAPLWRLHSLCGILGIALNTFVLWMFVRRGNAVRDQWLQCTCIVNTLQNIEHADLTIAIHTFDYFKIFTR